MILFTPHMHMLVCERVHTQEQIRLGWTYKSIKKDVKAAGAFLPFLVTDLFIQKLTISSSFKKISREKWNKASHQNTIVEEHMLIYSPQVAEWIT